MDNISKLYADVSKKLYIGTEDKIRGLLSTKEGAEKFYNVMKDKGVDLGNHTDYMVGLGHENLVEEKDAPPVGVNTEWNTDVDLATSAAKEAKYQADLAKNKLEWAQKQKPFGGSKPFGRVELGMNDKVVKSDDGQWLTESGRTYDNFAEANFDQNLTDQHNSQSYRLTRMQEQLDEMKQEVEEKGKEAVRNFLKKERGRPWYLNFSEVHTYNPTNARMMQDSEINKMLKASQDLEEAQETLNELYRQRAEGGETHFFKNSLDFWKNLGSGNIKDAAKNLVDAGKDALTTKDRVDREFLETIGKIETWDFGITDSRTQGALASAILKRDNGQPLTETEQLAFNAAALRAGITNEVGDLGWAHTAGNVAGSMLPFIIETIMNPASGFGSGISKLLTKYAIKKYGKEVVKSNIKKYLVAKGAARVGGDILGSLVGTATTGFGRTAANAAERQIGSVQTAYDENGNIVYGGHVGGEDALTAWTKAFAGRTIENWSEMSGAYFAALGAPIKAVIGKGIGRLIPEKMLQSDFAQWATRKYGDFKNSKFSKEFNRIAEDIKKSKVYKGVDAFKESAQIGGLFEEYLEEKFGDLMRLIIGDTTFDTNSETGIFNLERNVETLVSLIPTQVGFGMLRLGGARTANYQYRQQRKAADKYLDGVLGENWKALRMQLDAAQHDPTAIAQIYSNMNQIGGNIPINVRRAVMNYINAQQSVLHSDPALYQSRTDRVDIQEQDGKFVASDKDAMGNVLGNKTFETREEADAYATNRMEETRDDDMHRFMQTARGLNMVDYNQTAEQFMQERGFDNMTAEEQAEFLDEMSSGRGKTGKAWIEFKTKTIENNISGANFAISSWEQAHGLEPGTIEDILDRQPTERTIEENDILSEAYGMLHDLAYPQGKAHVEQSKLDGIKLADEANLDAVLDVNEEGASAAKPDNAELAQLKLERETSHNIALNTLRSDTDMLTVFGEVMGNNGADAETVIQTLASMDEETLQNTLVDVMNEGVHTEKFQSVVDAVNAQAKYNAFIQRTGEKIDEKVERESNRRVFKGTLNGAQYTDKPTIITATDGEHTYQIVNSTEDIVTDDKGNVTSQGVFTAIDENGNVAVFKGSTAFHIDAEEELLTFAETMRQGLQEAVSEVIEPTTEEEIAAENTEGAVAETQSQPAENAGAADAAAMPQPTENTENAITAAAEPQTASEEVQEEEKPSYTKSKMVYDEKGNEAFDRMPIADTMEELLDGQLEDEQVAELIDNNIEAYEKEVAKLNEKKPKKTTSRAELIAATNKLKEDRAEAERKLKYWQDVKAELAKITHTTEEEMTALSEAENPSDAELGIAGGTGAVGGATDTMPVDAVAMASGFLGNNAVKISPESFRAETGFGTKEQRGFVGMFAGKAKGGKTINEIAEALVEYDNAYYGGNYFKGDSQEARNAVISAFGQARTKADLRANAVSNRDTLLSEWKQKRDDYYYEEFGMSYDDYMAYEGEILKDDIRREAGVDTAAMFADADEAREETVAETESQPAENTTEEEGETEAVPQSTTASKPATPTDAKEPFRARAREWSEKTGVDVVLLESIDDVESDYVRNQIIAAEKNNQQVKGWYDDGSGRVFIYMPHAESEADVEATFVHEVVSHKGLRELLGNAAFDTLCDNVFETMSPEAQAKFLDYVGAEDINNPTEAEKRAAADEYIAHLAENTDLTDAEKSVWDNIVKMIRTALETLGLSISITDDVLSNLIKASYAEMVKNRRSEEAENDNEESEPNMGDAISFRVVDTENPTDFERKVLEDIETGNTQKVYRGMQVVEIDGQRYALPPMASKIEGEWAYGIKINDDNTLEPVLLQSDERPDLIGKDGKFKLDKGNGKSVPAAYNPYWHTSATMLNDQFAEAQDRPNLITVEGLISNTDLESGYKADNAKDAVGEHEWKAGTITGQLTGKRKLYLSRYFQGLRVVPDSEVAQSIYNQINGVIEYMPSNVLPPSVRTELEKLGVKFLETNNNNELLETEHKGDKYTWWYGKNQVKNRKKAFVERAKKEGMLLSEWLEKEGRTGQLPDKEVASADKTLAKGSEQQGVRFRYTEEESSLVDDAKKNGTWMKAPNGKPTNLTEKQWAQVRTKAFKDWFGDWELANLLNRASIAWNDKTSKGKVVMGLSERAKSRFNELLGTDIKQLVITDDAIRHIKKKHGENEELRGQKNMTPEDVVVIPYLINNFDSMELNPKENDNKGNRAIEIRKRINGISVIATIERGDNKEFLVTSYQYLKSDALDASNETPGLNVRNDSDIAKVRKDIENIKSLAKNSSKIVDENGEPMVVYHGSMHHNFTVFKNNGSGIYFTPDKDAADYGLDAVPYAVFINMREPLNLDFEGDVDNEATENHDSLENEYKNAIAEGYDGVVAENTFDGENEMTQIVVHRPNQIKSATDNVGTFDEGNEDIRFRKNTLNNNGEGESTQELFLSLQNKEGEEYNDTVNEIADRIVSGRARVGREDLQGRHGAQTQVSAAGEIISADRGRVSETVQQGSDASEESTRELIEKSIEDWARQNGVWMNEDDIKESSFNKQLFDEGGENRVYLSEDKSKVTKLFNPYERSSSVLDGLRNISVFNTLFPDTAYNVVGYLRDGLGMFRIVMEQPFIQGNIYDMEEYYDNGIESKVRDMMENIGLQDEWGDGLNWYNEKYYVSDTHFGNVIEDKEGEVHIIDANAKYNEKYKKEIFGENGFELHDITEDIRFRVTKTFEAGSEYDVEKRANKYFESKELVTGEYQTPHQLLEAVRNKHDEYAWKMNDDATKIECLGRWNELLPKKNGRNDGNGNNERIAKKTERAKAMIGDVAKMLGLDVEVIENTEGLTDKKKTAKGWYEVDNGKIVVVLPNHTSNADVMATLLHEGVAHHGLRKMFGEDFDNMLDNVYEQAWAQDEIDALAGENASKEQIREATEEYLARLAEDMNFEKATEQKWWDYIREAFVSMLRKAGITIDVMLTDNELRYLLWRSYQNLKESAAFDEVRDSEMQQQLGVVDGTSRVDEALAVAEDTESAAMPQRIMFRMTDAKSQYAEKVDGLNKGIEEKGLRGHLGEVPYKKMMRTVYEGNDEIAQNASAMLQDKEWNLYDSIETYLADEAQTMGNEEMWQDVRQSLANAVDFFPSIKDTKYAMWLNKNRDNDPSDPNDGIKRNALLYKLEREEREAPVRFRTTPTPVADQAARAQYEKALKQLGYRWSEQWIDGTRSVAELQKAMFGKNFHLADSRDAHEAEKAMTSKIMQKQRQYHTHLVEPLGKAIEACMKDMPGKSRKERYENLKKYMYALHGLERNRYIHVRDIVEDEKQLEDYVQYCIQQRQKLDRGNITLPTYFAYLDSYIRQEIDKDFDADKIDKSGLRDEFPTDADALYYIEATNSRLKKERVNELWRRVRDVNDFALETEYQSGLISGELKAKVASMYGWYIPLRGFEEMTAEEEYDYNNTEVRAVGGPTLMGAKGRKSKADDPIATMLSIGSQAIHRAERNEVKKKFYRAAKDYMKTNGQGGLVSELFVWEAKVGTDNQGNDIYEVQFPDLTEDMSASEVANEIANFEAKMKDLADKGEARQVRQGMNLNKAFEHKKSLEEHIVRVYENGQVHVLYLNGNPRAAQSLNGTLKFNTGWALSKPYRKLQRAMSQMMTSLNLTFALATNPTRDFQSTLMNTVIQDGEKAGLYYIGEYIKNMWNFRPWNAEYVKMFHLYQNNKLDMNKKEHQLFKEFADNGGITGFIESSAIEDYKSMMDGILKTKTLPTIERFADKTVYVLGYGNNLMENMARFATYKAARKRGLSIQNSVKRAKNYSLNFNQRGLANPKDGIAGLFSYVFNALYLFVNPTMQAFGMMMNNFKNHPYRTLFYQTSMPILASSIIVPFINMVVASWLDDDDDDDVREQYGNLPEWERRNNICLYKGKGEWITIPLPLELRGFYAIGEILASEVLGDTAWGQSMGWNKMDSDRSVGLQVIDILLSMSPVSIVYTGGGLEDERDWRMLAPQILKPYLEVSYNKSWTGAPIWNDADYLQYYPEWQKAYSNTNPYIVEFCRWLNKATGGDDVQPSKAFWGWGNLNPAKIDHLLKGYASGPYKFVNKLATVYKLAKAGDKDAISADKFPITEAFWYNYDEAQQVKRYNALYYKYKEEAEKTTAWERGYIDRGDINGLLKLMAEPRYKRRKLINDYETERQKFSAGIRKSHAREDEDTEEVFKRIRMLSDKAIVEELDKIK